MLEIAIIVLNSRGRNDLNGEPHRVRSFNLTFCFFDVNLATETSYNQGDVDVEIAW
jgi:hypothetical protein